MFRASFDLAINSRMVGLGRIDLDNRAASKQTKSPNANQLDGADGGVQVEGHVIPHHRERWLPYTAHPDRSRLRATFRHAIHSAFHFFIFDTMLALLWKFGGSTIANATGTPNALQAFVDRTSFVLFPRSASPIRVPTLAVEIVVELSLAAAIWQAISSAYHALAALLVGAGLWEVQSWEVDLFDAPWKADSILDLWGRRWHQIFRVSLPLPRSLRPSLIAASLPALIGAHAQSPAPAHHAIPYPPARLLFFRRNARVRADRDEAYSQPDHPCVLLRLVRHRRGTRGGLQANHGQTRTRFVGKVMDMELHALYGQDCVENMAGRRDGRQPVHPGRRVPTRRVRGEVGDRLAV